MILQIGQAEETMPMRLCIPASQAATAEYTDEEQCLQFLRGYRRGALTAIIGETYTYDSLDADDRPYERGYRAGRTYVQESAKTMKFFTLLEFGYQIVDLEGVLRLNFEQQHFTPVGEGRPYWIIFPDSVKSKTPKGTWPNGKRVKVKGRLSPVGEYGHMNMANHQLVVLEIAEATKQSEPDASAERP
jgi:hypothetical protein